MINTKYIPIWWYKDIHKEVGWHWQLNPSQSRIVTLVSQVAAARPRAVRGGTIGTWLDIVLSKKKHMAPFWDWFSGQCVLNCHLFQKKKSFSCLSSQYLSLRNTPLHYFPYDRCILEIRPLHGNFRVGFLLLFEKNQIVTDFLYGRVWCVRPDSTWRMGADAALAMSRAWSFSTSTPGHRGHGQEDHFDK